MNDIAIFENVTVSPNRKFYIDATNEECIERMISSLQETIDYLCQSPYCDKDRIMSSQFNIVVGILSAYLSGKTAFILEAPTGVGKSIIGVIVVETIKRYMKYKNCVGYILTSSKMLQDQMDRDKNNFHIRWAVLKGQANYECRVNGKTFLERDCKDYSIPKAIETMNCAQSCGYIQARLAAMSQDVAILSYAYWLTSMNFVYEKIGEYAPFRTRHITVFDECHMLSDVVQGMFQQTINDGIIKKFTLMHDLLLQCGVAEEPIMWSLSNIEQLKIQIKKLVEEKISIAVMFERLQEFEELVGKFVKVYHGVCNKYLPKDPKEWIAPQRKLDNMTEGMHNFWMSLRYFISQNEAYQEYIVKTYQKDKMGVVTMTLRSLREQDLIREHVHKYCDFQLFMSATVGDADVFARNNGIDDYECMYIESKFDYSQSPIYNVNPPIAMSMKYKNQNMQELLYRIVELCERHGQERGLIHTGNFEIARNLKEFIWEHCNTPRRFLFYNDSFQKQEAIKKLQRTHDGILVGPSLTEGLDLKDDWCRFMILAKVPYPMLDEYNSKKMKLMPDWYGWKTSTTIIQSLGRGIRHQKDWCVSYLMDSCFNLIFQKQRIPRYITSRITSINLGNIQQKMLELQDEVSGLFNYQSEGVQVVQEKKPETVDTIDVEGMLKESQKETTDNDKEEWDDLPF